MRRVDPEPSSTNVHLVLSQAIFTSTFLYTPKAETTSDATVEDALYVVTSDDKAQCIFIHRGAASGGALVAQINYPSECKSKKSGSVIMAGREEVPFAKYLTRPSSAHGEHKVTIAGQEHTWREINRRRHFMYPLSKANGTPVCVYIPASKEVTDKISTLTRAHIEFEGPTLPEVDLLDGIVTSMIVIQHSLVVHKHNGGYDFMSCTVC